MNPCKTECKFETISDTRVPTTDGATDRVIRVFCADHGVKEVRFSVPSHPGLHNLMMPTKKPHR